jgi:hypothetical protein
MNYLFTNAPLFVPSMERHDFEFHDLERRVEKAQEKGAISLQHDAI